MGYLMVCEAYECLCLDRPIIVSATLRSRSLYVFYLIISTPCVNVCMGAAFVGCFKTIAIFVYFLDRLFILCVCFARN